MLKKVVLPAPFGPIRLMIEPSGMLKSTSLTATRPPNSLRTAAAISRSAISGLHVVERLVGHTLLELELAPGARNEAVRPEQHHDQQDHAVDPELVLRHVDVEAEMVVQPGAGV